MAAESHLESFLGEKLNILLVSHRNDILTALQGDLFNSWKNQIKERQFQCQVHTCNHLSVFFKHPDIRPHFDYFVFVVNPEKISCLKEIEDNIEFMGDVISRQQICLCVIGEKQHTSASSSALWDFARAYQFNIIFGHSNAISNISNRVLNLVQTSCGIWNGVPFTGKI